MNLKEILELKMEVAADLYRDGKISRGECFKHEVAVAVQQDPGHIVLLNSAPTPTEKRERI